MNRDITSLHDIIYQLEMDLGLKLQVTSSDGVGSYSLPDEATAFKALKTHHTDSEAQPQLEESLEKVSEHRTSPLLKALATSSAVLKVSHIRASSETLQSQRELDPRNVTPARLASLETLLSNSVALLDAHISESTSSCDTNGIKKPVSVFGDRQLQGGLAGIITGHHLFVVIKQ